VDGRIPLGTLKKHRNTIKDLRGPQLRRAKHKILTAKTGNPNFESYLNDGEKRGMAEYVKKRASIGKGLSTQELGGADAVLYLSLSPRSLTRSTPLPFPPARQALPHGHRRWG
jgi:hypothetical protein